MYFLLSYDDDNEWRLHVMSKGFQEYDRVDIRSGMGQHGSWLSSFFSKVLLAFKTASHLLGCTHFPFSLCTNRLHII